MSSVGMAAVIEAGKYANESGRIVTETARTYDVLIASPKWQGERVTVRKSSVEVYG